MVWKDRGEKDAIFYRLLITWTCIILQQQLYYGAMILTFSFLQRCTFKLKAQEECQPKYFLISKDLVKHLTIKICDKILQNIARRFDVSRTSLSSEGKIMKSSIYREKMNKLKVKQRVLL